MMVTSGSRSRGQGTMQARAGGAWRRWLLLIAAGCACQLPVTAAPAEQLSAVQLDGDYFSRNGHRFVVVGAHWVPAKAAMQWPLQWDPQDIEADFAQMARMGFNTVRLDLMRSE